MTLWLLGLNHQTAPVDLRERVAFAGDSMGRALASLRSLPEVSEAALLSTCNRTEVYAVAADGDALAGWLDGHAQGLAPYLYRHHDADAVRLAQDSFASLPDSTVLLIGAGETIELAARHLAKGGVGRLLVANRTLAHAQDLASRHGGYALPLAELDRHLAEADVVFSATASREPVLRLAQVEAALAARRRKPMLLFDLAVPRDIEPGVSMLNDAYLYTVDDLERAVEDNRRSRHEAAEAAEAIIDLQVARYMEALRAGGRQETLKRLRTLGESTRDDTLARARQQLAGGRDPEEVLQFLAHTLTNRLLHPPTAALREATLSGDTDLVRAAERLFPHRDADPARPAQTQPLRPSTDDPEPAPQA